MRHGRPKAFWRMHAAAKALMDFKPRDEADRAAPEEALLACLGKPSEADAMRVRVTCGGAETVKALEPILDDADAQRAVYAAWVMSL
jgi:hypothetical protein